MYWVRYFIGFYAPMYLLYLLIIELIGDHGLWDLLWIMALAIATAIAHSFHESNLKKAERGF